VIQKIAAEESSSSSSAAAIIDDFEINNAGGGEALPIKDQPEVLVGYIYITVEPSPGVR
jgi:hypothetical protein